MAEAGQARGKRGGGGSTGVLGDIFADNCNFGLCPTLCPAAEETRPTRTGAGRGGRMISDLSLLTSRGASGANGVADDDPGRPSDPVGPYDASASEPT